MYLSSATRDRKKLKQLLLKLSKTPSKSPRPRPPKLKSFPTPTLLPTISLLLRLLRTT